MGVRQLRCNQSHIQHPFRLVPILCFPGPRFLHYPGCPIPWTSWYGCLQLENPCSKIVQCIEAAARTSIGDLLSAIYMVIPPVPVPPLLCLSRSITFVHVEWKVIPIYCTAAQNWQRLLFAAFQRVSRFSEPLILRFLMSPYGYYDFFQFYTS